MKKKKLPTQTMLFLRVVIGGYLAYLGYGLLTGEPGTLPLPAVYGIGGAFAVIGAGFAVYAVKEFLVGNYQGGAKDPDVQEEALAETRNEE